MSLPPSPLSTEMLASRDIKVAQNALFVESTVRVFEQETPGLEKCPAFYDYILSLSAAGVQMLTYAEYFSDMCDASSEDPNIDMSTMPLPELPTAQGLENVDQLIQKRTSLCPEDTVTLTSDTTMINDLFNHVQIYQGLEMMSLQSNFKKIHSTCKAVGVNGGQEAPVGAYNHTVNLRSNETDQSFCGGTLFSPTHVLTAAHCNPSKVKFVSVGGHLSSGSGDDIIGVKSTWPHPEYNSTTKKNDIMIVELGTSCYPSLNVQGPSESLSHVCISSS